MLINLIWYWFFCIFIWLSFFNNSFVFISSVCHSYAVTECFYLSRILKSLHKTLCITSHHPYKSSSITWVIIVYYSRWIDNDIHGLNARMYWISCLRLGWELRSRWGPDWRTLVLIIWNIIYLILTLSNLVNCTWRLNLLKYRFLSHYLRILVCLRLNRCLLINKVLLLGQNFLQLSHLHLKTISALAINIMLLAILIYSLWKNFRLLLWRLWLRKPWRRYIPTAGTIWTLCLKLWRNRISLNLIKHCWIPILHQLVLIEA